ncbi:hypothetical protein GDO81_024065 [Engystomops pustulosus]|nr:hypothetical protein GDO81_024065 [Engystomops pustulosus]
MSEFRIHHDVNELISLLGVHGSEGAELYTDLLQKNRTPYVTTSVSAHSAKVKIAEFSRTPEDFLKKYEELKSKNLRNLDPLVYLLSKLTEDKETLQYLQQNAKDRAEIPTISAAASSLALPPGSSKISMQELEELRRQLGSVTASTTSGPQPVEVQRKQLRDKLNKKNVGQPIPVFPQWVYERPTLTGDFSSLSNTSTDVTVPIGTLPLPAQEASIVEDLLYVLIGVDGRYITSQPIAGRHIRSFIVDSNLDMSIKELVSRILPLASSYSTVTRSIKHYFLMDQGDFFVHFMDLTEEELKKKVEDIIPTRLEALLELALRMSTANTDPFKDDLKIELMPHDLITQLLRVLAIETRQEKALINVDPTELELSGLEAFSFDYIVKWPLSLIISRKALTRYQMLFRHMFYCKHVERLLCNVWIGNKAAKQFSLHSAKWFAGAFTLRQRMLNFVQNIQYYMMFEVMEPTWHILEKSLKLASNIDDVLGYHTSFLDNCLKDCMLTNPELLKMFSKLMSVCVMFTNCMQRFTQSMQLETEMQRLTLEHGTMMGPPTQSEKTEEAMKKKLTSKFLAEHVDAFQSSTGFESTINNFDNNFSIHLMELLDKLSMYSANDCEHNIINIIYR